MQRTEQTRVVRRYCTIMGMNVFVFVGVLDVKWNKKANDKNCVTVWLSAYQCSFIEKY